MTGPEHYQEAERLFGVAQEVPADQIMETHVAALVHATLAKTAAVIDLAHDTSPHVDSSLNADAWTTVLGDRPRTEEDQ